MTIFFLSRTGGASRGPTHRRADERSVSRVFLGQGLSSLNNWLTALEWLSDAVVAEKSDVIVMIQGAKKVIPI